MSPDETVVLARYVRALCPQQKFDEFTPDAWHDVLAPYPLAEARTAAAAVAGRQPFVSPAEIITVIRQRRGDNARDIQGPGLPAAIPDADPDDVRAYLAAVRQQRTKAAEGLELKPRDVPELLSRIGREVPSQDTPAVGPLGVACPHCGAQPLHGCRSPGGRLMKIFHPSRILAGRGDHAQDRPNRATESEEIRRRREASRAALAALPSDVVIEPADGFKPTPATTADLSKEA